MARRRFRDPDPLVRLRNQADIDGQKGVGGITRLGGSSGSGGGNIVLRPTGGQGAGTQIEHVTLTATADQTIASGGAAVEWDQIADAPTEIRGFSTLQDELSSDGSVSAIPVSVRGLAHVRIRIPFTTDVTGTCTIQHIRGATTLAIVSSNGTGPTVVGGESFWVEPGDQVRVWLDLDAAGTIDDSGDDAQIALDVWANADPTSSPEWIKVSSVGAWDIHFDGTSWWTTGGDSETVSEYDAEWALQSSFDANYAGNQVRGITSDGTDLWVLGDDSASSDTVKRVSTAGVLQSSFGSGFVSGQGVAFDGTDLWVSGFNPTEMYRYTTGGTKQATLALEAFGLAINDGKLVMVAQSDSSVQVRQTDGTLLKTVDTSGAAADITGVWVADDGTLYVSKDGVGVWRWARGKL